MATTFDGTAAITALINSIQSALNDKVNVIDVAAEVDGVRIKNVKFAHEAITGADIQSLWADMNYVYDPTNGSPIVLYNSSTNKKEVVACADYNATDYPTSTYTPIGIVVIPKSHTGVILGEENAVDIMMSLKHMNYSTPDTGGSAQYMYWGRSGTDISELFNYTKAPIITNSVFNENVSSQTGYSDIPSDKFSGTESQACPGTYYHSDAENLCPSPFLVKNGVYEPNPAYYEEWNSTTPSITSDFKGKENTQIICSKITVADWQTAASITNSYSAGNYPAAACCWRYSTPGTAQGDWYLPAMGELGYLMPFFNQHAAAVSRINEVYGAGTAVQLLSSDRYWSSSEYNSNSACRLYASDGNLYYFNKNGLSYVVAFCKVA